MYTFGFVKKSKMPHKSFTSLTVLLTMSGKKIYNDAPTSVQLLKNINQGLIIFLLARRNKHNWKH